MNLVTKKEKSKKRLYINQEFIIFYKKKYYKFSFQRMDNVIIVLNGSSDNIGYDNSNISNKWHI